MIPLTFDIPDEGRPEGLDEYRDFLNENQERCLVAIIDTYDWEPIRVRRVQQYGAYYGFSQRLNGERVEPMPGWLEDIAADLVEAELMSAPADNVIINEYLSGQGIGPHIDSSWFGPEIVTISLLDSWAMDFTKDFEPPYRLLLERRSAVAMTGPARYEWQHQIAHRQNDYVFGTSRARGPRRISMTFRTIVGDNPAKTIEDPDDARMGR